ncbi:MAG: DUF4292 domain-containing protein [Bacteroidales bacterium]|nr:DUF4292 domain-containing protein [Bacteroidales bacterium]
MKSFRLIFLILIPILLVSCKGKIKPTPQPSIKDSVINVNNVVISPEDAKVLNDFKSNISSQDTFNKVEIKFNVDFKSGSNKHSGSGTLRMISDSLIWLSVSALNIEVARAIFTPDSVKCIVKVKNKFFSGDYSYLHKFFPVDIDFNILQSIFLDQFFIFPQNKIERLDYFHPIKTDNLLSLTTSHNDIYSKSFGVNNSIKFDLNSNKMLENSAIISSTNKGLKISYSEFKDFSYHNLPSIVNFEGINTDFLVVFKYQKVVFGKKMSFNFTIPNNYKPFEF